MSGVDFDREIAQIYRDMELYLIESMPVILPRRQTPGSDTLSGRRKSSRS